ncbi:CDP-alcohol phosphatidyltransferase family protein [Sorangium cellulosum]|uniref:CDP-alcohol phosphatidyltransferase family protein n=1 Tax=Sorangium cellulosum TaxID=56 RepID=UPI000CF51311|nr:CDP-alcohol phosphatidyltransferase family protein [Sorangium cellulosum]
MLGAYAVRVARHGRPVMPRLGVSPGSALLPGPVVEAVYWSFHAPARALVRLRVSPDTLTYLSLALSLACAPLLASGRFRTGAALLVAGAVLDALDGMVARAGGRASRAGAVLDSCVDRLSDAAPLIGLALFYRERAAWLAVPLVAMVASSLVSYARAKADIYRISLPNGLMRRHERIAYLVAALVFGPAVPAARWTGALPFPITIAGVAFVACVGLAAGLRLVQRTRASLAAADAAELPGPRITARGEGEERPRLLGGGKASSAPL